MSRIVIGLAMAVGLVGGAALGQVGGKPEASPGSPPEAAAKSFPGSPGARPDVPARSFPGSPGARPEPAVRSVPSGFGGLGTRPDAVPPRRPSEPPDPRAAMVMVQAVLVELVQDESGTAGGENPPPVRGLRRDAGPGDRPRAPDSPGPIGRADPAPRGKSELGVIDLDLAAPHERIRAELQKLGVRGRTDVLNRIQVTTLDKQPAYVQFGRQEPMIMGVSQTTFGQTNSLTLIQTGLLVSIVPRVTPGDAVILEIDLSQSRPGRLEEGKAIFVSAKGETIRQPSMLQTQFRSTVKVPTGKTVAVVAATSESGPRRTETLLLVSARVLNVKGD